MHQPDKTQDKTNWQLHVSARYRTIIKHLDIQYLRPARGSSGPILIPEPTRGNLKCSDEHVGVIRFWQHVYTGFQNVVVSHKFNKNCIACLIIWLFNIYTIRDRRAVTKATIIWKRQLTRKEHMRFVKKPVAMFLLITFIFLKLYMKYLTMHSFFFSVSINSIWLLYEVNTSMGRTDHVCIVSCLNSSYPLALWQMYIVRRLVNMPFPWESIEWGKTHYMKYLYQLI